MNIMFQGKIPDYIVGRILPVNRKCFELMAKLKEESNYEQLFGREVMASCLTEFIAYMARQAKGSVPEKMPDSANYKKYHSEFVNRALKVIADEYSKPLTMKILSKSAGIGESRLRQLLKSETGENFNSILHKQRILAAKHLINEGTYSLEQISTAIGYQYPSFFFRIFKRITGMTPGAYSVSLGEPQIKA
jgi:YesN/AraC family two-component response regulator